MKISIVVTTVLFGLCTSQEMITDPISIDPCHPSPTPDHPFIDWDGTYLDQEWWEYVKQAKNFPKKFRRTTEKSTCKKPWSPKPDKRRFYWQISCPYEVFWLSKFTQKLKYEGLRETCYVLFPCKQQVRIVNCTSEFCSTRCRTNHPNIRNSVCLENSFRKYRNVWVFCTHTHKKIDKKWQEVDCRKYPHFCLKRVTLSVPQCCECWSCWDMYVTMPMKEAVLHTERGKK